MRDLGAVLNHEKPPASSIVRSSATALIISAAPSGVGAMTRDISRRYEVALRNAIIMRSQPMDWD
jgi:hypothetical protein